MTGKQYQCPFCGFSSGSKGSVKGHITRKTDETHAGKSGPDYADEISPVTVDSDGSDRESVDSGNSVSTPSFPTADSDESDSDESGPDCCDSPSIEGSAGDVYQLDSGQYVRLESGDRICVACDTVHE